MGGNGRNEGLARIVLDEEEKDMLEEVVKVLYPYIEDINNQWQVSYQENRQKLDLEALPSEETRLLISSYMRITHNLVHSAPERDFSGFYDTCHEIGYEMAAQGLPLEEVVRGFGIYTRLCQKELQEVSAEKKKRIVARRAFEKVNYSVLAVLVDTFTQYRNEAVYAAFAGQVHDLRQKLAVVDGFVNLYRRGFFKGRDDVLERYVNMLERASHGAEALVSQAMETVRLLEGTYQLDRREVQLSEILQDVIEPLYIAVDGERKIYVNGLEYSTGTISNLSVTLNVDPILFSRVLGNLLSNAVKYSTENISIELGEEDGRVQVRVRDDGQGIDSRYYSKIFDPGYQVPGTKKRASSGIGLHVAKTIIGLHGGEIGVQSEVGNGSCFYIYL
jgi:signal transduction histidine kinase